MNSNELKYIPINNVLTAKSQPRTTFDAESLEELAASIRQVGIIQPLTVQAEGGNMYRLISGERRLRAATLAGLREVPCIVVSADEEQKRIMMLVENIQREDLNYIEEARAFVELMRAYELTQEELSVKIGKKQSSISNKIRLLKLGTRVIEKLSEVPLTERHARALLSLPDEASRLDAIEQIIQRGLNVRQTEQLINKMNEDAAEAHSRSKIKNYFNYRIYTNTIKQTFETIKNSGAQDASYQETRFDDRVEVTITIPLKKEEKHD